MKLAKPGEWQTLEDPLYLLVTVIPVISHSSPSLALRHSNKTISKMPPKSTRKRPCEETDPNINQGQPSAKKAARSDQKPGNAADNASGPQSPATTRRIPKGPKGEVFMPQIMPAETHEDIEKIPMPKSWVGAIDATPDRGMTLGSREWWEDHGSWLEANREKLKLSAKEWNMKDEAMEKEVSIKDDEGNLDWDFICLSKPASEDEDEFDKEDEEDDEANKDGAIDDSSNSVKANPNGKLASLHPDHVWVVSMLGRDRCRWWQLEALKRDQDDFGMYVYNDFSHYGKIEVIENIVRFFFPCKRTFLLSLQFLRFEQVLKKRDVNYNDIWPEMEGFALALNGLLSEFISIVTQQLVYRAWTLTSPSV